MKRPYLCSSLIFNSISNLKINLKSSLKSSLMISLFCVFYFANFAGNQAFAQQKNYTYHPVYIYQFCKYVQWPGQGNERVIGVIGSSPLIPSLQKMANAKSTPEMRFVIKKFAKIEDVTGCNILFVPTQVELTAEQTKRLEGKNTLLITENEKYIQTMSSINFIFVKGRLAFQLNKKQVSKANLKVASKLLSLAILV